MTPVSLRPRGSGANRSGSEDNQNWIAEVSHELRLPIANIRLLVETLLDGAIEDRETALRMLNRTKQEVERLQALVVDLLSIEEVAEHQDDLKRQHYRLAEAACYAIDSTRELANSKGIEVRLEIEEEFKLFANPEQLQQVLLNLVENAIKYTPENGLVAVRSGKTAGAFEVSDSGIGIEEQEVPKIFKRFYRVDRTRAPGSTGLGLSIVKHIVDLHGARISVRSEAGKGSTFLLEFPEPGRAGTGRADSEEKG